ncbi:MAG: dihydrodipicolinate reductase, partial [bacterium]
IADKDIKTPHLQVRREQVAGIIHVARAIKEGKERVRLELQMYVDAEDESDTVIIDGDPPIHVRVDGGIFGDKATIARMVNAIPVAFRAEPGLKTVMDLPLTCYFE